ncbi:MULTISPECIES: NCS1 family nucleobase:cation symporter-1 [Streptomyces]|uniref:NCS1 family nucleobase:cation symporter-1 n=1 Tax=Streptomyces doudnae TaxID=3075536 RepID=A0ABD5EX12_9ACTN|nr:MULTISPECIES: NCS1 family nucleobase:cation symporter-1 [unclassified Streptomyces]MDT0438768.1 NCS1 family nucleobase:cation symporter-1 [Streptomyces sp. DSM 41981]SCE49175.1 nucleobase:cation symporter-1, NCS1 family [Streptomyces sp. SolWspMP-5a-2]
MRAIERVDEQVELTDPSGIRASPLSNEDLAPVPLARRTWTTYNYAALWMGIAHGIPTYYLSSGLIDLGMSWYQAVMTIALGNVIVLVPILLNSHGGAKYGIPYPVLSRAAFGTLGANVPALLRALSACGWFGIQTWVGGEAVYTLTGAFAGDSWIHAGEVAGHPKTLWLSFALFWLLQIALIVRGVESIRRFENWSAPLVLVVAAFLLVWTAVRAGGLGPLAAAPSRLGWGTDFWVLFAPSLMGMIAYFATMSVNIADFTRFARGQREQVVGQALGLPITMTLFSTIGALTTSATVAVYGQAVWDPIDLVSRFSNPFVVLFALLCVVVATVAVNVAANTVGPAYDFSNVLPRYVSFRTGGIIAGVVGVLMQPWRLLSSPELYIFTWLGVTGAFLGAIAGILTADYWLLRRRVLDLEGLYTRGGPYEYAQGFNWRPLATLAVVVLLALGGAYSENGEGPFPAEGYVPFLKPLFDYNWAVAFLGGIALHTAFSRLFPVRARRPAAREGERVAG